MNECTSLSVAHQSSPVLSVLVHHLLQQVMFSVGFLQLTTAAESCSSQNHSTLISREQTTEAPLVHPPPAQACCGVAAVRKCGVAPHAGAAASTSCPGLLGAGGGGAAPLGATGGGPFHPPSLVEGVWGVGGTGERVH